MAMRDMENPSGATAYITGGAQGIGLGIARAPARQGVRVARKGAVWRMLEAGWVAEDFQAQTAVTVSRRHTCDRANSHTSPSQDVAGAPSCQSQVLTGAGRVIKTATGSFLQLRLRKDLRLAYGSGAMTAPQQE
ncbi:hypothetical protein [Nonomuraea deserti]|uniref:hypothetical protein n=1 Tax=Nonomuraea deserti TaxID=1848322 RepID=UPI001C6FD52B|nr:hypothetical protein [Nonomuraea deserti]